MIKFAPNITIYDFDESRDIQHEVIWTFSSFLKGISSTRHRFNIHVVRDINEERKHLDGSIKSVWKFFTVEKFLKASKNERKHLILDLISDCLLYVSEELHWNQKLILEAKENSLKQNIDFQYSSKVVKNKTGEKSAKIELQITKDKVSIWVIFSSKSNDLIKKHLIDTHANQISIFRYFERPKWLNDSQFGFQFKNDMTLSISTENNEKIWSDVHSKTEELFKRQIDYHEKLSPREFVELVNW